MPINVKIEPQTQTSRVRPQNRPPQIQSGDEIEDLPVELELEKEPMGTSPIVPTQAQVRKSRVQTLKNVLENQNVEVEELPIVVGQIMKTSTPKIPSKGFRSNRNTPYTRSQVPLQCLICRATFNEKQRF